MLERNKGFGLIEYIFIILIIAIAALLAFRYFVANRFDVKITAAVTKIQLIAAASHHWLNTQAQMKLKTNEAPTISIMQLMNAKLLNNADRQDPWGGRISVKAEPGSPSKVQIMLPGASINACNNLKLRLAKKAYSQIRHCTNTSGYYGNF